MTMVDRDRDEERKKNTMSKESAPKNKAKQNKTFVKHKESKPWQQFLRRKQKPNVDKNATCRVST